MEVDFHPLLEDTTSLGKSPEQQRLFVGGIPVFGLFYWKGSLFFAGGRGSVVLEG